jgi:N-acetylneuraminic acid mutarotase
MDVGKRKQCWHQRWLAGRVWHFGYSGGQQCSRGPGGAVTWTDKNGNLWLFGGVGADSAGGWGVLNDLWVFNPANEEWTWIGGSKVLGTASCAGPYGTYGQPSIYGTLGVPATTNIPGARGFSINWTDGGGNLWLFGGYGCSGGNVSYLNDLWKFSPVANTWTWVSGNNPPPSGSSGQPGVYGTLGTPSDTNIPGGRVQSVSWADSSGNLWLFGGSGFDSTNKQGNFNDLWEFNPAANTWTWMSGSDTVNAQGIYGTLGVAATANVPGARSGSTSWTDSKGNFWLFGGSGDDSTGTGGVLNDLWEFSPSAKTWTWVSGSSTVGAQAVYGTVGVAATGNVPGSRSAAVGWIDSSGNLWLFGGTGYSAPFIYLNDLWEFNPTNKEWAWMSGSNAVNGDQPGSYGTSGTAATTNTPGGREAALGWTDGSGNFWFFGGVGYASTATAGYTNDLWRLQP